MKIELKPMAAASQWAKNCYGSPLKEAVDTNNRYSRIAGMRQKFMEDADILFRDKGIRSAYYSVRLQELCDDIKEDMDFCVDKIILLKLIAGNDLNDEGIVCELYNAFNSTNLIPENK